ncbi:MAG: hypothetical protein CMG11_02230 [Candidatus Marinimicrobia bacterium]|nr:hypothetical protein [Candidatus Neomarinimicrobiota bacterium]
MLKRDIHQWISDYGVSHQNPINKKIHWICVPLIMFTLLGLLSLVKIYNVNLTYLIIAFALLFYLRLSIPISIGMFIISAAQLGFIFYIEMLFLDIHLIYIYLLTFIIAWVGQFIGHKIEGQKPSFFEDLQFLLIGPAWLISFIYKKIGIKY